MHRSLLRLHLHPPFVIFLFVVAALGLSAGCGGFVYPPPTIPEAVQKQMFHVSDPIALLSFEPGRASGKIIGELHGVPPGWRLPQPGGGEGSPTTNFTYVGQFTVTTKSDEDGMPAGAEGTRKIYFHEDVPKLNFAEPRAYGTGDEVALDSISISFSFKENHKIVAVRMISQQKSARGFAYKGRKVDPPRERDTSDTLQGEYSADVGGYILRSLNE